MNKLWLITFDRNNTIEAKEINVLEEHTIKYMITAEYPFNHYNYIHKHNLNIMQYDRSHKIHYIVSETKKDGINAINDYIIKKIESYNHTIDRLKKLQTKLQ